MWLSSDRWFDGGCYPDLPYHRCQGQGRYGLHRGYEPLVSTNSSHLPLWRSWVIGCLLLRCGFFILMMMNDDDDDDDDCGRW